MTYAILTAVGFVIWIGWLSVEALKAEAKALECEWPIEPTDPRK
jgi:hypothetical protein